MPDGSEQEQVFSDDLQQLVSAHFAGRKVDGVPHLRARCDRPSGKQRCDAAVDVAGSKRRIKKSRCWRNYSVGRGRSTCRRGRPDSKQVAFVSYMLVAAKRARQLADNCCDTQSAGIYGVEVGLVGAITLASTAARRTCRAAWQIFVSVDRPQTLSTVRLFRRRTLPSFPAPLWFRATGSDTRRRAAALRTRPVAHRLPRCNNAR